jgi:hypothetical protein
MLKKLFSRSKPIEEQKIIVVSGLPRSGTSMMMKMLAEGGLLLVTDSIRQADEDNPNGYFEIEKSKALKDGNVQWLYSAHGKVVKVISYLLEFLPDDLTYDIIFMERRIDEILASQKKMLYHRNEQPSVLDDDLALQFREHIRGVKYWIAGKPNMRVIYVDYNKMLKNPELMCASLTEFLKLPLNIQTMQAVPNQSLYRNRS